MKVSESENKTEARIIEELEEMNRLRVRVVNRVADLEARMIALERGLEGVLRRMEESGQPDDEAGWYGRPE